jgi:hypothetical protein
VAATVVVAAIGAVVSAHGAITSPPNYCHHPDRLQCCSANQTHPQADFSMPLQLPSLTADYCCDCVLWRFR